MPSRVQAHPPLNLGFLRQVESRLVSVSSSSRFLLLKLNSSFFVLFFTCLVLPYFLEPSHIPESIVWGSHTNAWVTWHGLPAGEVMSTSQLWRDVSGPGIPYVRGRKEVGAPRQVPSLHGLSFLCRAVVWKVGQAAGL